MAESDGTRRWLLNSKLRPLPPHISHINPNKQHNQNGAETRRRYSIKAATMRIRRRCHYVTRYNKWRLRRQIYRPSPGGFNMARHVSIDVIKSLIFPLWWHPTSPTPPPRLPPPPASKKPEENQQTGGCWPSRTDRVSRGNTWRRMDPSGMTMRMQCRCPPSHPTITVTSFMEE